MNLPETETWEPKRARPSKAALPLTSKPPEMRRSLALEMVPAWVVVSEPNQEYEAVAAGLAN